MHTDRTESQEALVHTACAACAALAASGTCGIAAGGAGVTRNALSAEATGYAAGAAMSRLNSDALNSASRRRRCAAESASAAPFTGSSTISRSAPNPVVPDQRMVGSNANGVTEPGWERVQFWCTVISPYIHGTVSEEHSWDCDQYRNGVQLEADVRDETCTDTFGWREIKFNLSAAEARQLAAQLVAAADSHDGISRDGPTR